MVMLQKQCDALAENVLIQFRKKRRIADRKTRVRDLLLAKPDVFSSSSVAASIGGLTPSASASSMLSGSASTSSLSAAAAANDDKLEAKELDHVISELSILMSR